MTVVATEVDLIRQHYLRPLAVHLASTAHVLLS